MSEAQTLLIRLIMHPTNNPHLIDKLIILKGLPYEWVFKKSKYRTVNAEGEVEEGVGDALVTPWQPDVDVNIPEEVRKLTDPITYVRWFPDVQFQSGNSQKTFHGFWDKRTVWGLRLDYGYGPAQELWTRIEDYIEKTLPRGEQIPHAVQVAKDQKTEFRTFLAKRGKTLSSLELIAMEVPVVDLRKPQVIMTETVASSPVSVITIPTNPSPPTPEVKAEEEVIFTCDVCQKVFHKPRELSMHKVGAHRREKARV